jgi:hypothetical protein
MNTTALQARMSYKNNQKAFHTKNVTMGSAECGERAVNMIKKKEKSI